MKEQTVVVAFRTTSDRKRLLGLAARKAGESVSSFAARVAAQAALNELETEEGAGELLCVVK